MDISVPIVDSETFGPASRNAMAIFQQYHLDGFCFTIYLSDAEFHLPWRLIDWIAYTPERLTAKKKTESFHSVKKGKSS